MKLKSLRPIFYTDQLEASIQFYTQNLGFAVGEKNDDWGWASLHRDDVEIMLAKPNEHAAFEKANFTGSFYFNTDRVDDWWESLKEKVTICYGIEDFEWGMREFAIYDYNGYVLQFGQDLQEIHPSKPND